MVDRERLTAEKRGNPNRPWRRIIMDDYFGFNVGKIVIGMLKIMKEKGIADEEAILDLLWEAKDAHFPWSRQDIKELIKL
ncbi:hypothetical protein ACFL2Q_04150 [Thermodesulfobacteriota bacterium]